MKLLTVNLEQKLIAQNRRALAADKAILAKQADLDAQIEKLRLGAEQVFKEGKTLDCARELGFDFKVKEASDINRTNQRLAHLPQDRIFTIDAIKSICLTYGLRFLPTSYYKGALDSGIPEAMAEFKRLNKGQGPDECGYYGYYIAAPTESFNLTPRPKDPLLFASLGSDRFYLIHKWGDDLSWTARLKQMFTNHWLIMWSLLIVPVIFFYVAYRTHDPISTCSLLVGIVGLGGWLALAEPASLGEDWRIFKSHVDSDNWNSPFSN